MTVKNAIAVAAIALGTMTSGVFAQEYNGGSPNFQPTTVGVPDAPSVRVMDHRSTELGDALDGLSLVIESQGRFERYRSEAIVNLQQAERLRLQNMIDRERTKLAIQKQRLELQSVKAEQVRLSRQISLESQARMRPAVVITQKGSIQWIEPLRAQAFAAHRQTIENNVNRLAMARNLDERQQLMDEINFDCQELIETLEAQKGTMSASAYDSSRRFAIRLYDDLQNPTVVAGSSRPLPRFVNAR